MNKFSFPLVDRKQNRHGVDIAVKGIRSIDMMETCRDREEGVESSSKETSNNLKRGRRTTPYFNMHFFKEVKKELEDIE